MNDPITITEVVGRAVQGMTRPFLCKAGFFDYYVKGTYAGLDSLCCEWGENIEHRTPNIERRREEELGGGGVDLRLATDLATKCRDSEVIQEENGESRQKSRQWVCRPFLRRRGQLTRIPCQLRSNQKEAEPMNDEALPNSEIILYQTEDGRTRVQCRFENESLWLTQAFLAELFERNVRTINEHLVNIFNEGELRREATGAGG